MSADGIIQDILRQPKSLARVVDYHRGPGCSALQAAAQALRDAPQIILTGMGASMFACIPLQYYLSAKGRPAVLIESAELLHYQSEICRGALIVAVSRSGDTVEICRLLEQIEGSGAQVIGVTNESGSRLANAAKHVLHVKSHRDELVAIQSYTGSLVTLMMLGSLAYGDSENESQAALDRVLSETGRVIDYYFDSIDHDESFFADSACVYLLGRGPSFGSACAGALLLNETAKLPTVAMPAGQFRHGPVEVVDEKFRGIIFAPTGKTRSLNLQLARNLVSFGAQVRVIGPKDDALPDLAFWNLPADASIFTPVLEVIPLQIASLRVAQWRGIVPGKFRYVSAITVNEASFDLPQK